MRAHHLRRFEGIYFFRDVVFLSGDASLSIGFAVGLCHTWFGTHLGTGASIQVLVYGLLLFHGLECQPDSLPSSSSSYGRRWTLHCGALRALWGFMSHLVGLLHLRREPPCRFWCMDAPFTAWSANLICHCLHPHAVRNVWSPALWVCECRSRRHCYLMHFVGIASGLKCVAAVYSDCGYMMIQYSHFGDTHSPIHAYLSIPLRLRFWSVMWAEIQ